MEHLHDIAIAYSIGGFGGAIRHLSSNLINDIQTPISRKRVLLWFTVSGGFGVLVLFITLYMEREYGLNGVAKYAMIYVGGMLSREGIKLIIEYGPYLFDKLLARLGLK